MGKGGIVVVTPHKIRRQTHFGDSLRPRLNRVYLCIY